MENTKDHTFKRENTLRCVYSHENSRISTYFHIFSRNYLKHRIDFSNIKLENVNFPSKFGHVKRKKRKPVNKRKNLKIIIFQVYT